MSDVPVLDVVPPASLAPVRPRSRARSLFLVLVAFVLTTALGFIPAASANPALLVPLAKGVGAIGASVLTEKAFSAMWNGDGDKPSDDDNSDRAKKGRGKWGSRLQSLRDIGAGLLGALFGLDGLSDFDGIPMPDAFKDDVLSDPSEGGQEGRVRTFTIDSVEWTREYASFSGTSYAPAFLAECVAMPGYSTACGDPYDSRFQFSPGGSEVSVRYDCFHPTNGRFTRTVSVTFNRTGPVTGSARPCNSTTASTGVDVLSAEILDYTNDRAQTGVTNPQKFFNPTFDYSQLDEEGITVTAETVCSDPATDAVQTVSKTVPGVSVIPLASCPVGWVPQSTSWSKDTGAGSKWLGGAETKTPSEFPDCPPGRCVRIITVDDVPCRVGIADCYDWMNVQPPSRVKCEYGPYQMPIADCHDLQHIHKTEWGVTQDPRKDPQRHPGWLPANPDGTVDWTRVGTDVRPNDNPNPDYRPPVRGPLVGAPPQTGPTNPPTTAPTNPPFPTTGVNPPAPGDTIKDPETGNNCMAGMWSWNPVDWVLTPVKCALSWAFIPKGGGGLGGIRDKFTMGGFSPWLSIPPAMFDQIPSGGGCMGPPLNMPAMLGGQTYYPLNACNDPAAKFATMSRSVITLVVGFWGVFSIVNSVSTALTGYRLFERESTAFAKEATNK